MLDGACAVGKFYGEKYSTTRANADAFGRNTVIENGAFTTSGQKEPPGEVGRKLTHRNYTL